MTKSVKVAKIGKNAETSTDPNDFIFHSDYNTFKIVSEGTKTSTLLASTNNQTVTQAHGLSFVPLVAAFVKVDGESQVYPPNGSGVSAANTKTLVTNGVKFNYVSADSTNIYFNFNNTNAGTKDISIRYFGLEFIV